MLVWAFPGFAASNRTKTHHSAARKPSTASHISSAPHKRTTAKKPAARVASSHNRKAQAKGEKTLAKGRTRSKLQRQTWRTGQMAPTPERYLEIQQALVAKGYGGQEPDGVWGPRWIDSLKRFQQDQKLEPNGKLNALSIITLGLGPRRETGLPPASASAGTASTQSVMREQK
jgi:hypothetical protein